MGGVFHQVLHCCSASTADEIAPYGPITTNSAEVKWFADYELGDMEVNGASSPELPSLPSLVTVTGAAGIADEDFFCPGDLAPQEPCAVIFFCRL